jgi:hypothetical protein
MDVQLSIPTDHSHRISSNDFPQSDVLKNTDRKKILHYRQFYVDLPDPIVLFPVVVNTSGHLHDDFQESSFVNWLIGVFIGTQTFSVPTSSC